MLTKRYVVIDVFTDRPLTGNPLAVFTNAQGLDGATMQALARETNLSETTFVLPPQQGGDAQVRIFTPRSELEFAGHPTLGTALVLAAPLEKPRLVLELKAGLVPVAIEREGARAVFGWIDTPVLKPIAMPPERELLQALGNPALALPIGAYSNGPEHWCVALRRAEDVAELAVDLSALARLAGVQGTVSVFHHDAELQRVKTRVFAPGAGVPEDPATGSAAAALAWHLHQQGQLPLDQPLQLSQGAELQRPSLLHAVVAGGPERTLVRVGGGGCIVARGEFALRR